MLTTSIRWIENRKQIWLLVCLALLGIAAFVLLLWSTAEFGIGVRSDSVDYVWAADTLAQGHGLGRLDGEGNFKPLVQFPPLYSSILAFFEVLGVGPWVAARWLAALFFAVDIVLIGLVVFRLTKSSVFALAAAGFALIAPSIFEVNSWAMTEALFVAFVLLGFLFLDTYFHAGKRYQFMLAGFSLALAFLTRYVGAAAIGAAGLVLFLRPGKPWREKFKEAALFGAIALLPVALWMGRNKLIAGSAANKIINYHPITQQKWAVFKNTLTAWAQPLQNFFAIGKRKLAALLALGVGSFFYSQTLGAESRETQPPLMGWLLLIYVIGYIPVVFLSVLFAGAAIPLDDRMMYPVYTVLIAAIFYLGHELWERSRQNRPALSAATLIIFGFFIYTLGEGYAPSTLNMAIESREHGRGYALSRLETREVVQTLLTYPDDYVIYTDNVHQLYYFSGRLSYLFPIRFDTATQLETGGFDRTIANIQKRIANGQKIMFVFFFEDNERAAFVSQTFPEMKLIIKGDTGTLYVSQ